MSDIAEGGSAAGFEGPLGEATNPDASVAQPSRSRRGRVLGLGALVVGVLGAAVWFVGPSLMPERCFVNGEEVPCDAVEALLVEECFLDAEGMIPVPCGDTFVPNDFLALAGVSESGFPESERETARVLYDRWAASVLAIGPVLKGLPDEASPLATAWLVHPGYVVTNQHVIEYIESSELADGSGGETEASLLTRDGSVVRARLVAVDAEQDIALLELLSGVAADPIPVAERLAIAGEPVIYVGHPGRMERLWVTGLGVVTGYYRPGSSEVLSTLPGHPGASGSPIMSLGGQVVSLLTGGSQQECPVDIEGCIADASVQYASLPVSPTTTRGVDGPAIRAFFEQATGEQLPPSPAGPDAPAAPTLASSGSVASFELYRARELEREAGQATTASGFPVSERATVAALYERVSEAVLRVESPEGAPIGTAWLAGPTLAITNEHVATPARDGDRVMLRLRDGRVIGSRIIEESGRTADDLTILRLDAPVDIEPLRVARMNVGLDVPVFFVGHPGWMEQPWITGLGVTTRYDARHPNRMLTTVPAEAGASGSPVINLEGEVVAILSFITSGDIPLGGYPVADRSVQYVSVPVSPGAGGVDASTLRSYIERHAGTP